MKSEIIRLMKVLQVIDQLPVTENGEKTKALNNFFVAWSQDLAIPKSEPGYLFKEGNARIKGCLRLRRVRHITYTNPREEFSLEIKATTDGGLPPSILAYFFAPGSESISIGG